MAIVEIASQVGLYPACHDMATMKKPAEIQKCCPVAQAGRGEGLKFLEKEKLLNMVCSLARFKKDKMLMIGKELIVYASF
jgi:hypothetical protein